MPDRSSLPGMTEDVAAQRLILKLLAQTSLPPGSAAPECRSEQTLLDRLDRHGVCGRLARVSARDLPQVEVPTLVQLKDDRWLLVTRMRLRRVIAEDALGNEHVLSHRAVSREFAGLLFDRASELPQGETIRSRVLRLIWLQKRILYPAAGLAVLAQALSLLAPQLTRILVDDAFPATSSALLQGIVLGMVLVALLKAWVGWLEQRGIQLLQTRLDAILERGLLAHTLRLPYRFLESKSLGQLIQGFEGIAMARSVLTGDALAATLGGITALALIAMMTRMMPGATLLVVFVGMISAMVAIATGRRQDTLQRHVVDAAVRERESAVQIFTRMATLKAAGAARRAVDRWLGLFERARVLNRQSERLTLGSQVAIDLLGQMQLQGLWIWGGLRVMSGSLRLGELMAFAMMAGLFHAAVGRLASSFVKLRAVRPHLVETRSLLSEKPVALQRNRAKPCSPAAIEIRDLWFRYRDDLPWVFAGLDLVVAPGEMHRLDGRSGFGKTTLLKLVAGMYEPSAGRILVGGCPPCEAREQMIHLPQQVRILNASVRENLRLFSAGAPLGRLLETAQLTGLAEMVESLPMGYDTLLAHAGGNFSGGQRQLIALTAALASNRSVLLLDEATAGLDSPCVKRLVESQLFAGRTVLYASHNAHLQGG